MSATSRRAGNEEVIAAAVIAGLALAAVGVLVADVQLVHAFRGGPRPAGNPVVLLITIAKGRFVLGAAHAWVAAGLLLVVGGVGGALFGIERSLRSRRERIDRAAAHLARGRELAPLTTAGATATAARFGLGVPGLPLGRRVGGGPLWQDWESVAVHVWGPRQGKALAASTPVLTPHGWVPIKDLARGCRVIGADGRPTTVTGVYPQGVRPAYRLHLSDGTSVVCDPDHLWTVRPKIRADKKQPEAWRTWTTQQLLDNGLRRASGGARYYLPIVSPIHLEGVLPEGRSIEVAPPAGKRRNVAPRADRRRPVRAALASLPLDPYLLGVLIGDGGMTSGGVRVSTGEPADLLPLLSPVLPPGVEIRAIPGDTGSWALSAGRAGPRNPLIAALRSLGLMGHSALTKFVPEPYLLADVDTRWALLAGLLDTDGSIDVGGAVEFSTSSPRLSDDVRFLVQSLGGTVTTTRRETTHAPSWRSHIRLPAAAPAPFRLPRKRDRWDELAPRRHRAVPVRAVVAIEPEGEEEMVCISVAAPDGLFVTEHCIVTHNTMSAAIPAVLEAPGPCLATSNKRDLLDATRDPRALLGGVWAFDPMGLARERPTWWWNPLTYVTDEVQALKLARVLTAAAREPGARTDAYFDKAGPTLIAGLLYAAALAGRPITQVYDWLCDPLDYEPSDLLAAAGKTRSARAVLAVNRAPEKQRGGIYGTAQELMSFLISEAAAEWVTPGSDGRRPQFDPDAFVRSSDTLYLLSKEGDASTGPLVTALTVAVSEAAERAAEFSPGGRLGVPLVLVLDEAANICRWHALPDLYSHFGSKGIAVITFLQSWSQGVDVWGREGMNKLWSAANLRVVGSGVAEAGFLEDLAKLVPTFWRRARAGSRSKGVATTSWSDVEEPVLTAANLHAMPKGRAILFSSGAGPTLLRTVPWTVGPHAGEVKLSILAHDPAATVTLAEAEKARAAVEHDVPAAGAGWAS